MDWLGSSYFPQLDYAYHTTYLLIKISATLLINSTENNMELQHVMGGVPTSSPRIQFAGIKELLTKVLHVERRYLSVFSCCTVQ